tara:strand:+ start:1157 stop:1588 length:432 start_codon:yes stop_codon:yes gene_type:complete
MWRLFVYTLFFPIYATAAPIVPKFTSGRMESNSVTKQIINETIVTQNYRTGFTYNISGTNIRPIDGTKISPDAEFTNNQTVGGISFNWVSPKLENKIEWEIVNEGQNFSIMESYLAPGLDAQSTVQRTIETEITSNTLSVFGQ